MVASSHPYAAAIRDSTNTTLTALAAAYLQPWAAGITQRQLDDAHLHWADYRDPQWGGYLPPPTSINRLLRLTILSGRLHYVNSASSRSSRRLARQRVALRLVQHALDAHGLPDLDLVLSIADRPTVPRRLATRRPPPVFAYARTHAHLAIPFPYLSFDPLRWPRLHAARARRPPLARREPKAIWRGACNSLCDMMRGRRCSPLTDLALLDRYALLRAAERCPHLADVAITAHHRNCPGVRVLPPMPMAEHARYAFLLHVDGNGFSGRLDELFSLGGAILKQDSPFEAFYYPLLRRGVHFAPLHRNLSNLCHEVHRLSAQAADGASPPGVSAEAQRIASEGAAFSAEYLSLDAVTAYLATLLRQYAALQRFRPRLPADAVLWRPAQSQPTTGQRSGREGGVSCGHNALCCQRHPRACRVRADAAST
ncbi:hypothetical protein AB1Y20_017194 [Prymnesium parvum]|uniref:Glycosyl transferase CAP10 domain-containing protein n=1 Tax=Prymnesium parvum TaxID=97485 RepID=A0AB34I9T9_PRYPA